MEIPLKSKRKQVRYYASNKAVTNLQIPNEIALLVFAKTIKFKSFLFYFFMQFILKFSFKI